MPKESQDKQLLKIIMKLQEKVEVLAGNFGWSTEHINSHAFNELSSLNMSVFEELKALFGTIGQISNTPWFLNMTNDPAYHRRQVLTRKEKINAPGHKLCGCGDWISEKNTYFEDHQKRNKCVSNRYRIAYDTSNWKLKKMYKLDSLLVLNGHISELKNSGVPRTPSGIKYSPYGMYCLKQLIRRRQVYRM